MLAHPLHNVVLQDLHQQVGLLIRVVFRVLFHGQRKRLLSQIASIGGILVDFVAEHGIIEEES
jgi:hypothetical protein